MSTFPIWSDQEYSYPMSAGFTPFLTSYLHAGPGPYPAMLVIPGGGYCFVSPTEAEPVAKRFYNEGYNAFVLTYTVNPLGNAPLGRQPLNDIARAVRVIRSRAGEFQVDPGRLAVCGFSAGGHLAASLCVHYEDAEESNPSYAGISPRPDAAVLCYPVITSGPLAHRGSFDALLGPDASQQELDYMSLERHVTAQTPPCFLWQTMEDGAVPVENSYLFAQACQAQGVPYAHHVFTKGQHGLSLADEDWLAGRYGETYSTAQVAALRDRVQAGQVPGVEPDAMDGYFMPPEDQGPAYRAKLEQDCRQARVWAQLAAAWLADILQL